MLININLGRYGAPYWGIRDMGKTYAEAYIWLRDYTDLAGDFMAEYSTKTKLYDRNEKLVAVVSWYDDGSCVYGDNAVEWAALDKESLIEELVRGAGLEGYVSHLDSTDLADWYAEFDALLAEKLWKGRE